MNDADGSRVYKQTVLLGDFEMEVSYSEAVFDDIELPPMALVMSGANYHEQMRAVHKFLSLQDRTAAALREDLDRAEEIVRLSEGDLRDWLTEDLIERWQSSVYDDATRSMAVAVMLTPLVESLFHRLARSVGAPWRSRRIPREIMKIVTYCGLHDTPADLRLVLTALFEYRNRMFHWGVEWPVEERSRFEQLRRDCGWPESWFDQAIDGEGPWTFYLSEEFVTLCLDLVEQLVQSVGKYVQTNGLVHCNDGVPESGHHGKAISLSPLRAVLGEKS